jgi:hypothetical protein
MRSINVEEDRSPEVKYVSIAMVTEFRVTARYFKVHVENVGIGPS